MSTTLARISASIVGVSPGIVLLQTTLTNEQIQVPGFLNQVENVSDVQVQPTDFVLANCSDGSEYYVLEASGTRETLTLVAAGGAFPEEFRYINTYWVAQNGSDTLNDGKSIGTPFLTIGKALGIAVPGATTVINIADQGSYNPPGFVIAANTNIIINGPAASLLTSGGPMFQGNGSGSLTVNVHLIDCSTNLFSYGTGTLTTLISAYRILGNINNNSLSIPGAITVICKAAISGSVITSSGNTYVETYSTIFGNITDTAAAAAFPSVTIKATEVIGNISSTNFNIDAYVPQVTGSVNGVSYGFVKGVIYGERYGQTVSGTAPWTFNPGKSFLNQQFIVASTNGTITLPLASTVGAGYRFTVSQQPRNSGALVQVTAPDTMNGQINSTTQCYTGAGKSEFIVDGSNGSGGAIWVVAGDVFNTSLVANTGRYYVSQDSGSDATGDGTFSNPFASFSAALTAIGNPGITTSVIGLDGATYDENIVVPYGNINILSPDATIAPSSGDALTFSGPGSTGTNLITFGNLMPVSGNAIVSAGSASNGSITVTGVISTTGWAWSNGDGINQFLRCPSITGNFENTGGGNIFYTASLRSGTDDYTTFSTLTNAQVGIPGDSFISTYAFYPTVFNTCVQAPTLTNTNLAGAAQVALITPKTGTGQYSLVDIFLNGVAGTNFATGDRDIAITDGTTVFTVIPSASLLALTNARWGSVAVPFPAAAGISQQSAGGAAIYAQYSGGTTDYASGAVAISLIYAQSGP